MSMHPPVPLRLRQHQPGRLEYCHNKIDFVPVFQLDKPKRIEDSCHLLDERENLLQTLSKDGAVLLFDRHLFDQVPSMQ